MWRSSSSSSHTPSAITRPLPKRAGGSGTRVWRIRWRRASQRSMCWPSSRMLSCGAASHASLMTATQSRLTRRPCMSRGVARPTATLERMRSISPTRPSHSSHRLRKSGWRKKCSTPSCRRVMSAVLRRGKSNQRRSRRAPIGVSVRSITASSDWPPSFIGMTSSRLRTVNLSNRT